MENQSKFLRTFTLPIVKYLNWQGSLSEREQFSKHGSKFLSDNKDLPFKEFINKAEQEFGIEVQYYERYFHLKYLAGIYNMLKYFVIVSVISITLAVIALLSSIK